MTDDITAKIENYLSQTDVTQPEEADQPEQEDAPLEDVQTSTEGEEQEVTEQEIETPDDAEGEEQEEPEDDTSFITIKHNGEEKTLSKEQVIELTQKGYDYDVKTAKLAEQRRELETQAQRTNEAYESIEAQRKKYVEELQVVEAFNSQPLYTPEQLQKLLTEQGAEAYLLAKEKDDQRQRVVEAVRAKIKEQEDVVNQSRQKELEELKAREAERLKAAMPELLTQEGAARLVSYLTKTYKFTPEQINGEMEHRLFMMAEKARRFDEIEAKSKERKPVAPIPKVTKPTKGRQDASHVNQVKYRESFDRLKKTGKPQDAAEAIARLYS